MNIEELLNEHADYNPKDVSIGIAFTRSDAEKWKSLNKRLEKIDSRLTLAVFARKRIKIVMDELEQWANDYEEMKRTSEYFQDGSDPRVILDQGPDASS